MRWVLRPLLTLVLSTWSAAALADADTAPPRTKTSIATELAVSAGATMMLAPAVYSAARLVGTSSGSYSTSIVPAVVIADVLPPAIATGALIFQRQSEGRPTRVLRSYLFSLGAQVLVLTGAYFAKAWVANTTDLLLLSAVSGAACGAAATLGAELPF